MIGDLRTYEKLFMRNTLRRYGPRVARAVQANAHEVVNLCPHEVARFMRLAERLLKLHEEQVERRASCQTP